MEPALDWQNGIGYGDKFRAPLTRIYLSGLHTEYEKTQFRLRAAGGRITNEICLRVLGPEQWQTYRWCFDGETIFIGSSIGATSQDEFTGAVVQRYPIIISKESATKSLDGRCVTYQYDTKQTIEIQQYMSLQWR